MSAKGVVASVVESIEVEFGIEGAYESVQENGFLPTVEQIATDKIEGAKEAISGAIDKAKDVGGYLKEDFNNIKEGISDLFASDEEKAAKKAEEEAQKAEEEAEQKALEEEMERQRELLDKSYILHTALVTCDKAYTNEEMNPSYIVVPKSHGVTIHGLPQLTINDFLAEVNVLNFGICRSPHNPGVQEAARKIIDEVNEESKSWTDKLMSIFADESKEEVCTGSGEETPTSLAEYCAASCTPDFTECWVDGKSDVLIDGVPTMLGKCTLSCIYGGAIQIQSSGQMEE